MRRLYDIIGLVAMIATRWQRRRCSAGNCTNTCTAVRSPMPLAVAGGISGAVAIESVGIYAGHRHGLRPPPIGAGWSLPSP